MGDAKATMKTTLQKPPFTRRTDGRLVGQNDGRGHNWAASGHYDYHHTRPPTYGVMGRIVTIPTGRHARIGIKGIDRLNTLTVASSCLQRNERAPQSAVVETHA